MADLMETLSQFLNIQRGGVFATLVFGVRGGLLMVELVAIYTIVKSKHKHPLKVLALTIMFLVTLTQFLSTILPTAFRPPVSLNILILNLALGGLIVGMVNELGRYEGRRRA